MSARTLLPILVVLAALAVDACALAQQPAQPTAAAPSLPPLFFKEEWQQRARPSDAPADFVLEGGVTPAAVTSSALELKIYDPNAASVAAYRDKPPTRSNPRDWGGPSCVQLAGFNQNPPPQKVPNGQARTRRTSGPASARRRSRSRSAIARAMSISRDSRTSAGSHARPGFTSCARS